MSGPLTFRTLADYASTYQLHADGPACRQHAAVNPHYAARRIGWNAELRAAVTCSQCERRGTSISIVSDGVVGRDICYYAATKISDSASFSSTLHRRGGA